MMGRAEELEHENRYLKKLLGMVASEVSAENIKRMRYEVNADHPCAVLVGRVQGMLALYGDDGKGSAG